MNTRNYITTIHRLQLAAHNQRIALGLSPAQLAELSGVSRRTIASIEAGEPGDPAIVIKLASALNTVELAGPREDDEQSEAVGLIAALPSREVAA